METKSLQALNDEERRQADDLWREAYGDAERRGHMVVVFKEGQAIGFLGMETAVFLGPIYVVEDEREGLASELLVARATQLVPEDSLVIVVSDNSRVQQLARLNAMEEEAGKVFTRRA